MSPLNEVSQSSPRRRVALVTGASSGIGAATVRALAARGHQVVLTYNKQQDRAEALASEVGGVAHPLDLRDRAAILDLARRVELELGPVQILVHNAGLIRDALLPFLSEDDFEAVLDVNLRGVFRLTKALIKGMLGARWGRVVNIASISGVVGQLGQSHYGAAKAGVVGFTKAVARETASYGVTVNAIAPGFIDTDMLAGIPPKKMQDYLASIPVGRLGRPEEVAAAVAFLTSEEAAYITGQCLRIDGGLVMA